MILVVLIWFIWISNLMFDFYFFLMFDFLFFFLSNSYLFFSCIKNHIFIEFDILDCILSFIDLIFFLSIVKKKNYTFVFLD